MSHAPQDDDLFAMPQEMLPAKTPSRAKGSVPGWIVSLTLHAILLAILSRYIDPTARGLSGNQGSEGNTIQAFFGLQSNSAKEEGSPVDTRLPDPESEEVPERPRQTPIRTVSFVTQSRQPDTAVEIDQQVEPESVEETQPTEPPAPSPGPRETRVSHASRHVGADGPSLERRPAPSGDAPPRATIAQKAIRSRGAAQGGASSRQTPGTSFFGARGNGRKFVYVIDCSGSMSDRQTFAKARAELHASLEALPQTALVQVIFYNDQSHALGGDGNGLVRNSSDLRRRINQLSRSIVPGGGTHHVSALEMALDFDADAIFWLTDADEPYLSSTELRQLNRRNHRRVPIHAIEFGYGPALSADNFLVRAAKVSGGEYRYLDLTAERSGDQ